MIVLVAFLWCFTCVLSENATDGEIRLVGSNFTFEGRVEIYHNKEWGTICDDGWGVEETNVVCHQLGYMNGAQYWYGNAKFEKGHGKIWLDDVFCYGNESALTECRNIGWNGHNCRHYEDVGVVCQPKGDVSNQGNCDFEKGHGMCGFKNDLGDDFDWVFGSRNIQHYRQGPKTDHTTANTTGEGFYLNIPFKLYDITQGQKARLLSPYISSGSAQCLQFYYYMGGTYVGELIVYTQKKGEPLWQLIGDQGPIWKKGVIPLGSAEKEFKIIFEGIAGTGYDGSDVSIDDVSVSNDQTCVFTPVKARPASQVTPQTTLQLVGSKIKSAGRIEVYHGTGNDSKWGTICGNQFDIKSAQIVCKELGYKRALMVVPCCEVFGKGIGHIWMENVKCLGTEPSITMCPHSGWGQTHCSHDKDVGVICETEDTNNTDFDVRIVDGGVPFKGRVEVKIGELWGTVSDIGWDIYDANVVCKQAHFGGAVGAYSGSSFGNGKGPIWMSNFQCKGSESSLAKCIHNSTKIQEEYGHSKDASVECYGIRLVGGQSRMSGRVEVQYEGLWGTVCDHGWNQEAANVVCRQLGYRRAESADCCARFGAGSGHIFLDEVRCNGNESSLSFCSHRGWTAHNCSHQNDAGVSCTNAFCSKSQRCLNGGSCNDSSGTCQCKPYFVGETCGVSVENDTVEIVLDGKLEQWNETSFKLKMVKDLNLYCTKVDCSSALRLGGSVKLKLLFQVEDIVITEAAKQQENGVFVGIAVLYIDSTTEPFPKNFIHGVISYNGDKLAGYEVVMVDGQDEGVPAGRHANQSKDKSNTNSILIGVGVAVGLIALLVVVFIVKRYGRAVSVRASRQMPSNYSDQSYVALNTEAYDDSNDDAALLRPQPNEDEDLMS